MFACSLAPYTAEQQHDAPSAGKTDGAYDQHDAVPTARPPGQSARVLSPPWGRRESAAPMITASACATPAFVSVAASVGSPSAHVILHRRMGPAAPSGKPCSASDTSVP